MTQLVNYWRHFVTDGKDKDSKEPKKVRPRFDDSPEELSDITIEDILGKGMPKSISVKELIKI